MSPATVIIIDDERDVRDALREVFEDEGYRVQVAADVREGMAVLRASTPPCVVILDLVMPVMSGIKVYAEMLADERLRNIPVLVSTSDPSRAPAGVLLMKKPVDLNRLLEAIKALLC